MQMLSGLDASFLFLESAQMPMHVGALHWLELPAGYRGDFLAELRRHMASRLPLAKALRRKPAMMPLNLASPAWLDDEPDIEQHVVGVRLRRGSGLAEVQRQVGRLHAVLLDRDRPLWKFHLFEGLRDAADGSKRYALYTQLHHAAVDGQAAVALAQAILDLTPEPREVPAAPRRERKGQFGVGELLRGALANQLEQVGRLVKALPGAVSMIGQAAAKGAGPAASLGLKALVAQFTGAAAATTSTRESSVRNLGLAPRTRLNATVSEGRAFAAVSLPLDELNAIRRRHQASLNDALLMICSGALRRYFQEHGPLPRKSLVAAVPVSLRAKGDTAANNQASITLMSLGTHIADPAQRLAHVLAASASMKSTLGSVKNLLPTDFPSLGVPWLLQGMTALASRSHWAERLPAVANLTISNVPGPTVPLYIAGARLLSFYPASIVTHGLALNITVQSYNGSLDFGLIACAKAMPDVGKLAQQVRVAFAEFAALPGTAAPATPPAAKRAGAKARPRTHSGPAGPTAQARRGVGGSSAKAPISRRGRG
jgi:diacylglycerol O-acyltransferase / wax synthase